MDLVEVCDSTWLNLPPCFKCGKCDTFQYSQEENQCRITHLIAPTAAESFQPHARPFASRKIVVAVTAVQSRIWVVCRLLKALICTSIKVKSQKQTLVNADTFASDYQKFLFEILDLRDYLVRNNKDLKNHNNLVGASSSSKGFRLKNLKASSCQTQ